MRYVVIVLIAGCASGAAKEAAGPASAVAATWIGVAADGRTWYRLELDDGNTGSCATVKGAETCLYRVRRWSDDDGVTMHLEIVDGAPDAPRLLELRGRSETWRLELVVEGRHSLTLWREPDLIAARNRLKERMAQGPTTTANPP